MLRPWSYQPTRDTFTTTVSRQLPRHPVGGSGLSGRYPRDGAKRGQMWDQYKRTFLGIQLVITAVTIFVFLISRFWAHAVVFYSIMQLGSVLGVAWGNRLRRRIRARQCEISAR